MQIWRVPIPMCDIFDPSIFDHVIKRVYPRIMLSIASRMDKDRKVVTNL